MWQKSTEIAQHLYRLQLKFLFRFISVYPSYACVVMPISNELDTVSQSNGDRFHLRLHHLVLMRLNYFHELRCKKVCVCVCTISTSFRSNQNVWMHENKVENRLRSNSWNREFAWKYSHSNKVGIKLMEAYHSWWNKLMIVELICFSNEMHVLWVKLRMEWR